MGRRPGPQLRMRPARRSIPAIARWIVIRVLLVGLEDPFVSAVHSHCCDAIGTKETRSGSPGLYDGLFPTSLGTQCKRECPGSSCVLPERKTKRKVPHDQSGREGCREEPLVDGLKVKHLPNVLGGKDMFDGSLL